MKLSTLRSVSAHFDHVGVDGRVDDDPRASAQLCAGWQVNKHRLAVRPQRVHDQGPGLGVTNQVF
jgi:hypothetical protein